MAVETTLAYLNSSATNVNEPSHGLQDTKIQMNYTDELYQSALCILFSILDIPSTERDQETQSLINQIR